jgi:hypothetical protein
MTHSLEEMPILLPLVVALPTTLVTIIIHGVALITVVHLVRQERKHGRAGRRFWSDLAIVTGAALLALTAHLIEIVIWAVVLIACGQLPSPALFHSAMVYTTLSYESGWLAAPWKFLAPLMGADGLLMFGISTGMIFAVIERLLRIRFRGEYE